MNTDDIEELERAQVRALSEPAVVHARHGITRTVELAKQLLGLGAPAERLIRICSVGYGHLANLADFALDRTKYRNRALAIAHDGLANAPLSSILATTYANCSVDWFYDSFAIDDLIGRRSALAVARKTCERVLKVEPSRELRVQLLVQLASVLRCQAQTHRKAGGAELAERAKRTSEAACET